jgi:hypothetical protein
VVNSDRLFEQTQQQRESLAEAIFIFPTFLEESRATAVRPEDFSRNTKPLIDDLRPVTRELQPTVRALRRLAPDLRRYFHVFDDQMRTSLRAGPPMRQVLRATRPLLRAVGPFLQEFNPILEWLELHNHLIADFLGNGASATRDTIPSPPPGEVGLESLGVFQQRASTNRGNAYPAPMQLHPRYVAHSIFGNWDCIPSGGEGRPNDNPPARPRVRPRGLHDLPGPPAGPLPARGPGELRAVRFLRAQYGNLSLRGGAEQSKPLEPLIKLLSNFDESLLVAVVE